MKHRTIAELRDAAVENGFNGDPLTEEILSVMAALEADGAAKHSENGQLRTENERLKSTPRGKGWQIATAVLACTTAVAAAAIIYLIAGQTAERETANAERAASARQFLETIASKDEEIKALRASEAARVSAMIERLQSAVTTAQSASQRSETAAASSQETLRFLLSEVERLSKPKAEIPAATK